MVSTSSTEFAAMARRLSAQCHSVGLVVPGFRSPPQQPGLTRSLRRYPDGSFIVSILLQGRIREEVLADMVDGVLAINGLRGGRAEKMRTTLHWAVSSRLSPAA